MFGYLFFKVKVSGESLCPDLIPGRTYFATSLLKSKVGDYVVFENPGGGDKFLVKKVQEIEGSSFKVGGTVSWSSAYTIDKSIILGRII